MDTLHKTQFPIEPWLVKMTTALDVIHDAGLRTLEVHRAASEEASRAADQLQLEARIEDEQSALQSLLGSLGRMLDKLESARALLFADESNEQALYPALREAAQAIDGGLPDYEEHLLVARHCALDLLMWTQRAGRLEGSVLPEQYRDSYATLISYAPEFRPRIEAMQQELLDISRDGDAPPEVMYLLSSLTRFNSVSESSRAFIRSVVEPPLELVFRETDLFHKDWQHYETDDRLPVVTAFNECCQLLLYDTGEFQSRVDAISMQVTDELESSLYVMPQGDARVVFSVDEDPVFGQLNVTIHRVVAAPRLDEAVRSLANLLYRGLNDE